MPQDSRIAKRRQAALDAGSPEYVQRRAELIAAAARAFEAKGYDRTSFNDIAENAGIDRASLYYYVGNKSDLFDAVAITPAEANIRAIEEIRSSDLDPVGKLRAAIEQLMSSFDEHFPYLYIYIRENLGTIAVDAARRTKMQEIQERQGLIDALEGADGALIDASRNSSVGKALAVIEAFVCGPPSLGVTEVAQRAGIAKSTAFRLLAILADHEIVERRDERYVLGKKLFRFGQKVIFCRPRGLRDIALPHLVELYHATGATIQLAMLDGMEVLYIEKLYGYNQVRSPSQVGERLPASVTALGKALLAFGDPEVARTVADRHLERWTPYSIVIPSHFMEEMQRIRKDGYAIDREESSIGLVCIAAPVILGSNAIAAISISSQSSRWDPMVHRDLIRNIASRIAGEARTGVAAIR